MGYKRLDKSMTSADISLAKSISSNRSLKRLEKIEIVINWDRLNAVLLTHYEVGNSPAGADAYPPLMLLKGILLQKWYKIDSDPELENQINDRISFKKFLGISMERYIVEQYFGLSHLHTGASRVRFTQMIKNKYRCDVSADGV